MKKTNKKGFTIVELVIVIAVIAILAAVLIPTFSGVVEKAKASNRLQTARAALTSVLAEESTSGNVPTAMTIVIKDGDNYYKYTFADSVLNPTAESTTAPAAGTIALADLADNVTVTCGTKVYTKTVASSNP